MAEPITAQGSPSKGVTQGEVDPVFLERINDLRETAAKLNNATRARHQRVWHLSDKLENELINPETLTEKLFDRDSLNAQYAKIMKGGPEGGTAGDVIAVQMQIDYNAMEERAFRARHMTLPRSFALAAGRRFGDAYGVIYSSESGGLISAITNYIAAGSAQRTPVIPETSVA